MYSEVMEGENHHHWWDEKFKTQPLVYSCFTVIYLGVVLFVFTLFGLRRFLF